MACVLAVPNRWFVFLCCQVGPETSARPWPGCAWGTAALRPNSSSSQCKDLHRHSSFTTMTLCLCRRNARTNSIPCITHIVILARTVRTHAVFYVRKEFIISIFFPPDVFFFMQNISSCTHITNSCSCWHSASCTYLYVYIRVLQCIHSVLHLPTIHSTSSPCSISGTLFL